MFTITDFLNLMKYFKTGDKTNVSGTSEIDSSLLVLADDSKAKTTSLFSDNIDLACFATDDYKRLKNFLIPWYASLRTMVSTMHNASNAYSLPEEHLNNLLNSFGFVDGLTRITHSNKIDFFYDLVNLYKIKGTPESVTRVLNYFGFKNIELFEYWLQYDENKNLVFHPEKIISIESYDLPSMDVSFNEMVSLDPHWFLTVDQINQLFLTNKIAFPSKSPYFGIRPLLYFQGGEDGLMGLLVLYRIIQDAYYGLGDSKYQEKNYLLEFLRIYVTILDLYLGITYLMHLLYDRQNDSTDLSFMCYNGEMMSDTRTFEDIVEEFNNLVSRENNQTLEEISINRALYDSLYTRSRTSAFLTTADSAGNILAVKNSELKNSIDTYFSEGKGEELLSYLVSDLSNWMRLNISPAVIDIASLILGFTSIQYIKDVINFFKPYRARFILAENVYVFQDPLHDTNITEDELNSIRIQENILDWDTANSISCCLDSTSCLYYSRDTYDCGSQFDRGASDDNQGIDPEINITHTELDYYNHHTDSEYLLETENESQLITENGNYIIATDGYESYVSNSFGTLTNVTKVLSTTQLTNITGVILSDPTGPIGNYTITYNQLTHTITFDNGTPVEIIDSTSIESYLLVNDSTSNTILATVENFDDLPITYQTEVITISYVSSDSTKYWHLQDGGFTKFDSGGTFDNPAISDVCEIYVCAA